VEVQTTKKTEERRKDVALITIKTVIESRPFVVRAVIDAKTEKRMDVDEAVRAKILDQKRRIYVNSNTNEELSFSDALDSGLLEVEFDKELSNGNGSVIIAVVHRNCLSVDIVLYISYGIPVAVLGKNIWGPDPSSFGRQQRLNEITIEPIKNLGAWAVGKIWSQRRTATALYWQTIKPVSVTSRRTIRFKG